MRGTRSGPSSCSTGGSSAKRCWQRSRAAMLSSYFAAAWRAFLRDRLYAIINIIGLAIGLSAALLSGLYVRNELTFERFLPGYQNIYRISAGFAAPGAPMSPVDPMPPDVAPWLINHMPSIQPVAR